MSGYLNFERTGNPAFDAVLEAIEQAGDSYHHTSQWSDEYDEGQSHIDLINAKIREAAHSTPSAESAPLTNAPRTDGLDNEIKTNPPSDSPTPYRASEYESIVRLARTLERELSAARATIARLEGENQALSDDATYYRYIKANAPPEGCTLRFFEGGSSISWGVITEAELDAKESELQALKRKADYYQALRSANWHDGKDTLVVTRAYAVKLGMMTYSGDLLDEAIRSKP